MLMGIIMLRYRIVCVCSAAGVARGESATEASYEQLIWMCAGSFHNAFARPVVAVCGAFSVLRASQFPTGKDRLREPRSIVTS